MGRLSSFPARTTGPYLICLPGSLNDGVVLLFHVEAVEEECSGCPPCQVGFAKK
jgi:hypothetical protein